MQHIGAEGVGQRAMRAAVRRCARGVVLLQAFQALAGRARRPHAVAVAIELQPERRPGGHAQVAQAEDFVDEVEVVMQALALSSRR